MGLLDKMYEDGKYAAKERNKQNEINKKRIENETRQKEAEALLFQDVKRLCENRIEGKQNITNWFGKK